MNSKGRQCSAVWTSETLEGESDALVPSMEVLCIFAPCSMEGGVEERGFVDQVLAEPNTRTVPWLSQVRTVRMYGEPQRNEQG